MAKQPNQRLAPAGRRSSYAVALTVGLLFSGTAFSQVDQAQTAGGITAAPSAAAQKVSNRGFSEADYAEIDARMKRATAIVERLRAEANSNFFSAGWENALLTRLYKLSAADLAQMTEARTYADVMASITALTRAAKTNAKSHGFGTNNLVFHAISACRLLDTRNAVGTLPANTTRLVNMSNSSTQGGAAGCSTTIRDADPVIGDNSAWGALALNATVFSNGAGPAFLRLRPAGSTNTTAYLNWVAAGSQVANAGIVPLDTSGQFEMFATSFTEVTIDVFGAFGKTRQLTCLEVFNAAPSTVNPNSFAFVGDANIDACPAGYVDTGYIWHYAGGSGGLGPWTNSRTVAPGSSSNAGLGWTHVAPTSSNDGSAITVYPGRRCCSIPDVTQ